MKSATTLKLHLFLGLLILNFIGNFLDTAPKFWPIELSRIASSGQYSLYWFRFLAITLGYHLFTVDLKTNSVIFIWFSLLAIVFFDDVNYFWLHLLGVYCLIASVIAYGLETWNFPNSLNKGVVICCFCLIWIVRSVMKIAVIYFFEMENRTLSFVSISEVAKNIMYNGPESCINPQITMVFFKLAGVLQWVSFWLMSELIDEL